MNFNTEVSPLNMPELNWYWGCFFSSDGSDRLGMVFFFWRRGWFENFFDAQG